MDSKRASNAWRVTSMLFLANLLNFYDRSIPGIVNEPIRVEFGLKDYQLGLIAAAFSVVYAVAGIPLGRLADVKSRKVIMGLGLVVWSIFTGLNGLAWSFASYLTVRVAVGLGEASYSPAAISTIGDLFPSAQRSRAMSLYWLGVPVGLILAFFITGQIVQTFGTWRAPFFVAAIPGLLLAFGILLIKEPARGSAEESPASKRPIDRPIRRLLGIRTLWWLTLAGTTYNFSAYTAGTFLVPLLQRYFELPLKAAAVDVGVILGATGLVGLTLGGWIADRIHERFKHGRLIYSAATMALAAIATWYALILGKGEVATFVGVFAAGWFLQYQYLVCIYPAIYDVVEPRLRGVATALYFAFLYLLGGAFGPLVVGAVSDRFAHATAIAAGDMGVSDQSRAVGLHDAMYLIPVALTLTVGALVFASVTFQADADSMKRAMAED